MKKKIVIIAGGDGDIGFECVKIFLKSGYKVIVIDKKLDNKKYFDKNGVNYFKNNLKIQKNIISNLSTIKKTIGNADVLINCIGKFSGKNLLELNIHEMEDILRINIIYPMLLIKNFIKIMTFKNRITKIINIGSMAGQNSGVHAGEMYSISKAGIINLTKSISKKFGKKNIICNCINPGPLEGKITKKWPKNIKKNLIKDYKLNQNSLGKTSEVARVCLFLADDKINYIQGAELNINGGLII
jgi:3-oxoacyl-[acyl-carrier protein] reductase